MDQHTGSQDAWATDGATARYQVYRGLWTNWSRSATLGRTLTITRREGDFLIAFTALFITFVGTRFWRICCLYLHRFYSTSQPRNVIHHQRQLLLCNASTSDSGFCSLLQLWWAWRHSSNILFLLPTFVMATFCAVGFMIAGGFSSQLSSSAGTEVLVDASNCGLITTQGGPLLQVSMAAQVNSIKNALNYVQQCYSEGTSRLMSCDAFAISTLPSYINNSASCPFQGDICQSSSGNLVLDTGYLDTHTHFGINSRPRDRMLMRRVMSCAPLKTVGRRSQNGTRVQYDYGWYADRKHEPLTNFTYEVDTVEVQYDKNDGPFQADYRIA